MSGDKTEKPSAKRLRDARRKGQVAKSQDLSSSLLLIIAILVLGAVGSYTVGQLSSAMQHGLHQAVAAQGELDRTTAVKALLAAAQTFAFALAPFLAAMLVAAVLVNYLQVGPIFSFEKIKPQLNKLNPVEAFKQKFLKSRPYLELGKTLLKMSLTAVIISSVLWKSRAEIINLTSQNVLAVTAVISALTFEITLKVGCAFLAIGVADFFLQRFLHLKEMKMSKQEVKEEYKQTEGNPLIKSARRQVHREIMMQDQLVVKKADVVVVNPTHLAVALKYDRQTMGAPVVVAKGAELIAKQIRELAEEAGVPITRDVPLARALYELEIDAEVPEQLFEATATVLRWVYSLAEERGEVAR